jgi:2-methylcitrate dehydratase PrpD
MSADDIEYSLAELVLVELSKKNFELTASNQERLRILFSDFIACVHSGKRKYKSGVSRLPPDLTQNAVRLGLYSSADDLDDVDWSLLTHPGAIIWSTALSSGLAMGLPIKTVFRAAAYGYRTGSTMAKLFGISHRSKWHVTATSGVFASVSTLAVLFGLTPEQHLAAFKLCAMNIGGLPQANFEREGATQFNRSAAISLGISSVHAALVGAPHVMDIWSSPKGLAGNFLVPPEMLIVSNRKIAQDFLVDGISTVGLRLFPCTGFAHAAALAIYELRKQLPNEVTSITVDLAKALAPLLDGSKGGDWWDPRAAIAAIAYSNDLMDTSSPEHLIAKTQLVFSEIRVGGGRVSLDSDGDVLEITHLTPPGLDFSSQTEMKWRAQKWRGMIGNDYEKVLWRAQNMVGIEKLLD